MTGTTLSLNASALSSGVNSDPIIAGGKKKLEPQSGRHHQTSPMQEAALKGELQLAGKVAIGKQL